VLGRCHAGLCHWQAAYDLDTLRWKQPSVHAARPKLHTVKGRSVHTVSAAVGEHMSMPCSASIKRSNFQANICCCAASMVHAAHCDQSHAYLLGVCEGEVHGVARYERNILGTTWVQTSKGVAYHNASMAACSCSSVQWSVSRSAEG
jgi:hypothetical protein